MTKTTYTVPQVPGSSRTSLRPYTHAVIGRRDGRCSAITYAADLDQNETKYRRWDKKHWQDAKRGSQAVPGELYLNHNNHMVEASAGIVAIDAKFIAENPDCDAYVAAKAAARQEYLGRLRGSQPEEMAVLQWSMSAKNASKAVVTFQHHYSDVQVVECVAVEKKTKTAALQ